MPLLEVSPDGPLRRVPGKLRKAEAIRESDTFCASSFDAVDSVHGRQFR